jgi:hypothetical protein
MQIEGRRRKMKCKIRFLHQFRPMTLQMPRVVRIGLMALFLSFWAGALRADDATTHYDTAVGLLGQKKYTEAESEFRKSIAADPRYKRAWQRLAECLRQQGHNQQAEDVSKMAAAAPDVRSGPAPALTAEQLAALGTGATGSSARAQTEASAPAAQAAVKSELFPVGSSVEIKFDNIWYRAHVLKTDGEKRFITYDGFGSNWDEWVGPDRIKAVGAAAPAVAGQANPAKATAATAQPQPGKKGLDGLYLQVQTWMSGNSISVEYRHYWFRPDGNVYFGVPPGGLAGMTDFAVLRRLDPANCGMYGINQGKITLQKNGQAPVSHAFTNTGDGATLAFDGPSLVRVGKFPPKVTFDAEYHAGSSASGGGVFVSGSSTFHFHGDGSFESGSVVGFSSTGERVTVGGGGPTSGVQGKYVLGGNTLTLTSSDGKTVTLTVYPYSSTKKEFPPAHMGINGDMYQLQTRR